jgi:hypothetical protein
VGARRASTSPTLDPTAAPAAAEKEKPMTRHPHPTASPLDEGASRPSAGSRLRRRPEDGITTAEYAVGTAAGAGLAGLLYQLLTGGFGERLLRTLFDHVLGLLGIG